MPPWLLARLSDLLAIGGAVAIFLGLRMVHPALAMIAGGLACLFLAARIEPADAPPTTDPPAS